MQWTCEKCGLQRDDRRGSGCNGVKGQAHEWIETSLYEKKQRQIALQDWIDSEDSIGWKKEYERIKLFMKDETKKAQNQYLESLKNLEGITKNNNDKLIDIQNKEEQLLVNGEKIYKLWIEYNKKNFFKPRITDEQKNEIAKFLNFVKDNSEKARRRILGKHGVSITLESLSEFLNRIEPEKIWEMYVMFIKEETESRKKLLKKEQKKYLNEIEKDYISAIRKILEKGITMIKENNMKYDINEDYSYDNYDFSFEDHPNLYEIDSNYSLSYTTIKQLREKYMDDNNFIKKYNIAEYLSN